MNIGLALKRLEKLTIDNSPGLLTAVGVVGLVGTAVLTHRAATRSTEKLFVLDEIKRQNGEPAVTRREHFDNVWTLYIPPVVSGGVSIAAIIGANRIGSKRAAALAAAYTLSEKAYSEYRDKVVEKLGETKEKSLRDDIVRDRVAANPQGESNTVVIGSGEVLCYEMYTDRYFNSSVEAIKKAVNEVNYTINTHGYSSLSDFYGQLGLNQTSVSEEMGWTSDKLLDVDFTTILSEDGRPCVAINYTVEPVRGYHRFH